MKKLHTQYFSNRDETEFHRLVRLEHLHEFVNNHQIAREDIQSTLALNCEYGVYGYQLFYWSETEYDRAYIDVTEIEDADHLRKDEQYRHGEKLSKQVPSPDENAEQIHFPISGQ